MGANRASCSYAHAYAGEIRAGESSRQTEPNRPAVSAGRLRRIRDHGAYLQASDLPLDSDFDGWMPTDANESLDLLPTCLDSTHVATECDVLGRVSSENSRTRIRSHRRESRARKTHPPLTWTTLLLPLLLLLLVVVRPSAASEGDRSPEYQNCVDSCNRDSCLVDPKWSDGVASATRLPMILRLTFWTCLDDCRYHCTHRVTNEARQRVMKIRQDTSTEVARLAKSMKWGRVEERRKMEEIVALRLTALRRVQKEMVQYHGKWVFVRILGAQEPLSVLFSLANFSIHLNALDMLRRQVPDTFPLKLVYILHCLLSCCAWIWSAVFHTRDKVFTERMDYFGAGAVVLGGLFIAICRLWRLAPGSLAFKALARLFAVAFLVHILYLSFGRFDYGYNMKANIIVGLTHSLLWLAYSIRPELFSQQPVADGAIGRLRVAPHVVGDGSSPLATPRNGGGSPPVPVSTQPPTTHFSWRQARRRLQLILALLWLASSLEVFDFPPLGRALDAHALWHLATVPIARMWYKWLIEDARECTSSGFWVGQSVQSSKLAEYLLLPHKTEEAVETVTRAVGPPVMRAVERARGWVENAAGRSSSSLAMNDTAQSSGIEFKALTTKLNDFARTTLGNATSGAGNRAGLSSPTSPPPNDGGSGEGDSNAHYGHGAYRSSTTSTLSHSATMRGQAHLRATSSAAASTSGLPNSGSSGSGLGNARAGQGDRGSRDNVVDINVRKANGGAAL